MPIHATTVAPTGLVHINTQANICSVQPLAPTLSYLPKLHPL
jgi:hypothetical protein